eukprot:g2725.t1
MYAEYVSEILELYDEIKKKLNSGEEVDGLITQVERVLKQCTTESKKFPGAERRSAGEEIRGLKATLDGYKRQSLLGNGSTAGNATKMTSAQAKDRMRENHETMKRSSERLKQAQSVLAETEEVAMGTMQDLHRNRQTIDRNLQRNKDIKNNLKKSEGMVEKMSKWWKNL